MLIGGILKQGTQNATTGGVPMGTFTEPTVIEKHQFSKYEIRVCEDNRQNQPGYLFGAYNANNGREAWLFYSKKDDISMKEYKAFVAMKTVEEKKQYLQEAFLKYAGFNLGYVPEPVKSVEAPAEKETASATSTASPTETATSPTN